MGRPRIQKSEVDSRNHQAPVRTATISALEEPPRIDHEGAPEIDVVSSMDEATALLFAEDKLTIVIHNSNERHQEDPVPVGVNGRMAYVKRGQNTIMPRKYVERLLRAQSDSVEQDITAREEADFNRLTIRPTQRYPLSVLHDPHPNGRAWLQSITQSA